MTVQIPVLLWTVICFGALILILKYLLFDPMLAFMDRRSARIAKAAEKDEANRKALAEAEEALRLFREEEARQTAALAEKAVSDARRDADRMLADAAREGEERLLSAKEELAAASHGIEAALDEKTEELARAWLSSLMD